MSTLTLNHHNVANQHNCHQMGAQSSGSRSILGAADVKDRPEAYPCARGLYSVVHEGIRSWLLRAAPSVTFRPYLLRFGGAFFTSASSDIPDTTTKRRNVGRKPTFPALHQNGASRARAAIHSGMPRKLKWSEADAEAELPECHLWTPLEMQALNRGVLARSRMLSSVRPR